MKQLPNLVKEGHEQHIHVYIYIFVFNKIKKSTKIVKPSILSQNHTCAVDQNVKSVSITKIIQEQEST